MRHDPSDIAAIRKSPLFSALDEGAAGEFLSRCRIAPFKRGTQVFRQGQAADRFFLVLSGRVRIFKLSQRGDEQTLHLYGPGETFGEAAMWAGIGYPAHAEAVEDARLLVVSRQVLRSAIASDPELAIGMMAGMSAKLREFNLLIEQLSLKEVPSRVAAALLKLAAEAGSNQFRLRRPKREFAAQIGTVAETLSRTLGKMKAAGLIEVEGARIAILDEDALRELAE